jgi:hypothetical protein
MLREVDMHREADVIFFLAAVDYSLEQGEVLRIITQYINAMKKRKWADGG